MINSVDIRFSNGQVFTVAEATTPPPPLLQFYRFPHDLELPDSGDIIEQQFMMYMEAMDVDNNPSVVADLWRQGVPEVFRLQPDIQTNFGDDWQLLSYQINTTVNELVDVNIDKKKWRAVHDHQRAFHNKTGFEKPGDPRRDYVNKLDLSSPIAKWHAPLTCGGAVHAGRIDGAYVWMDTMNGNKSVIAAMEELRVKYKEAEPITDPLKWLLSHPWLIFDAVTVGANGNVGRFPQNNGQRVFIPFVSSQPVKYPLSKLQKLPASFDFKTYDPYKIP